MSGTSATKVMGFIGLGNMGAPMASRLLAAGYRLLVCDRNPEAVEKLQQQGAHVAESPLHIASTPGVEAVITMLPSTEHVQNVYLGEMGLLRAKDGVRPRLLVDSSTISPIFSAELAGIVQQTRLHPEVEPLLLQQDGGAAHPLCVDAPVSGGVPGAQEGTLTFMVGGTEEAVKEAEQYLMAMGRRVVHCGGPSSGQAAKVCNNLVLAISMAAVAEGLALGTSLGLSPSTLSQVFNTSSARCWSSEVYNPCPGVMEGVPSARDYQSGFGAALMVKDLRLALEAAAAQKQPAPMGARAAELYSQVVAQSGPTTDFSAIFRDVYKGC